MGEKGFLCDCGQWYGDATQRDRCVNSGHAGSAYAEAVDALESTPIPQRDGAWHESRAVLERLREAGRSAQEDLERIRQKSFDPETAVRADIHRRGEIGDRQRMVSGDRASTAPPGVEALEDGLAKIRRDVFGRENDLADTPVSSTRDGVDSWAGEANEEPDEPGTVEVIKHAAIGKTEDLLAETLVERELVYVDDDGNQVGESEHETFKIPKLPTPDRESNPDRPQSAPQASGDAETQETAGVSETGDRFVIGARRQNGATWVELCRLSDPPFVRVAAQTVNEETETRAHISGRDLGKWIDHVAALEDVDGLQALRAPLSFPREDSIVLGSARLSGGTRHRLWFDVPESASERIRALFRSEGFEIPRPGGWMQTARVECLEPRFGSVEIECPACRVGISIPRTLPAGAADFGRPELLPAREIRIAILEELVAKLRAAYETNEVHEEAKREVDVALDKLRVLERRIRDSEAKTAAARLSSRELP